jgi:hypothetical protein
MPLALKHRLAMTLGDQVCEHSPYRPSKEREAAFTEFVGKVYQPAVAEAPIRSLFRRHQIDRL